MHYNLSYVPEREARTRAIRNGWFDLGRFWTSAAGWRMKLRIFRAKVFEPALAGGEAFIQTKTVHKHYDNLIARFGRVLLLGRAFKKKGETTTTTGDDGETQSNQTAAKYEKLTTIEVLQRCGLPSVELGLKLRRLSLLQSWVRRPQQHAQAITAVFGKLRPEKEDIVTEFGFLSEGANPFAKRFVADLDALHVLDGAGALLEDLDGAIEPLFVDEALAESFLRINLRQLSIANQKLAIAPPGWQNNEANNGETATEFPFVCNETTVTGAICNRTFASKAALETHKRADTRSGGGHGIRVLTWKITTNNQCIACGSTFANRQIAATHINRSVKRGTCKPNLANNVRENNASFIELSVAGLREDFA